MADDSWIKEDRRNDFDSSKLTRMKVIITVAIILIGALGTLAFYGLGSNATQYQSSGIVLDFGNHKTVWTDIEYSETTDPVEMLDILCNKNEYTYTLDSEGKLIYVKTKAGDEYPNTAEKSWGLWYAVVDNNTPSYIKSETYDIDVSEYIVTMWSYTTPDGKPTIALDATNTSIYGYSQPRKLVTLSPVTTEIVSSLNALGILVGTDYYSNYPSLVVAGKTNGTIATVGTYSEPSYESIMHTSPDLVVCDGSQYSHFLMAQSVRSSDVNSVVIFDGTSLEVILDNIFIVGTAMHYELRAREVIDLIRDAVDDLTALAVSSGYSTMVALSTDPAPIVAGSGTYLDEIISSVNCYNSFADLPGWAHANSEYVIDNNPQTIVILSGEPVENYDKIIANLPAEWKMTDAYANGRIYLVTGAAADLSERAGPRIAQITELFERMVNPSAFAGEDPIPYAIGSNYKDYLTITKDLGFGD